MLSHFKLVGLCFFSKKKIFPSWTLVFIIPENFWDCGVHNAMKKILLDSGVHNTRKRLFFIRKFRFSVVICSFNYYYTDQIDLILVVSF